MEQEQSPQSAEATVTRILERQRDIEHAIDVIRDDLDEMQKRLDLNRLDLKAMLVRLRMAQERPWEYN